MINLQGEQQNDHSNSHQVLQHANLRGGLHRD